MTTSTTRRRGGALTRWFLASSALVACAALVACGAVLDFGDDGPPIADAGAAEAASEAGPAGDGGALDAADGAPPADAAADADAAVTSKLVFVTDGRTRGDMGFLGTGTGTGRGAADAKCQAEATAAGLASRTFVAWLSTSAEDAILRLPTGNVEWRLPPAGPTGPIVFPSYAKLAAGVPQVLIDRDAFGIVVPAPLEVYTGTKSDGTKSMNRCGDWSSASDLVYGMFGTIDVLPRWSEFIDGSCDLERRVYCFEQ